MKKSLLIYITLLLIFSLHAELNRISGRYKFIDEVVEFSGDSYYTKNFLNSYQSEVLLRYSQGKNNRFDRFNRSISNTVSVAKKFNQLETKLLFGYDFNLDKSSNSSINNYKQEVEKKQTGINFQFRKGLHTFETEYSFLFGRQFDGNNLLEDSDYFDNNGVKLHNKYIYEILADDGTFNFSGFFDKSDLDYVWNQNYGINILWEQDRNIYYKALFSYSDAKDKQYVLLQEDDERDLKIGNVKLFLDSPLINDFYLNFLGEYNINKASYKVDSIDNYDKSSFNLNGKLVYVQDRFSYYFRGVLNNKASLYKNDINNRDEDTKRIENKFIYFFNDLDSIYVLRGDEISQIFYPNQEESADNDEVTTQNQVGLYYSFRKNIRFINLFHYNTKELVYTNSIMSSNNIIKESYLLNPSLIIDLSDLLSFTQSYQLRADYDDYVYVNIFQDRMFRRFLAEYSCEYSNESLVTSKNFIYKYLLKYSYENNASGTKEDNAYLINNEVKINTLEAKIINKFPAFSYNINPKISWKEVREYYLKILMQYNFSEQSYFMININPTLKDGEDIFWRVELSMEYLF